MNLSFVFTAGGGRDRDVHSLGSGENKDVARTHGAKAAGIACMRSYLKGVLSLNSSAVAGWQHSLIFLIFSCTCVADVRRSCLGGHS